MFEWRCSFCFKNKQWSVWHGQSIHYNVNGKKEKKDKKIKDKNCTKKIILQKNQLKERKKEWKKERKKKRIKQTNCSQPSDKPKPLMLRMLDPYSF